MKAVKDLATFIKKEAILNTKQYKIQDFYDGKLELDKYYNNYHVLTVIIFDFPIKFVARSGITVSKYPLVVPNLDDIWDLTFFYSHDDFKPKDVILLNGFKISKFRGDYSIIPNKFGFIVRKHVVQRKLVEYEIIEENWDDLL